MAICWINKKNVHYKLVLGPKIQHEFMTILRVWRWIPSTSPSPLVHEDAHEREEESRNGHGRDHRTGTKRNQVLSGGITLSTRVIIHQHGIKIYFFNSSPRVVMVVVS